MEWKPYYDAELHAPGTREKITGWIREVLEADESSERLRPRTIWSFPHTAIDYCGPLQARVAASLIRSNVNRVIALGVMHGSLVAPYRLALDPSASPADRDRAFAEVRGALAPKAASLDTPFGRLSLDPPSLSALIRTDSQGLLRREFSLDTFGAVLRLTADVFGANPPHFTPLYVGMTRHPIQGSFETAQGLASELAEQWGGDTAIVTTGDVVHYGSVYGPTDYGDLTESLRGFFSTRLQNTFRLALADRDLEGSYRISQSELRSDQREILPVLAHLLGGGSRADLVSFQLSDYAPIFDIAPPCLVASSLIAYVESPQSVREDGTT